MEAKLMYKYGAVYREMIRCPNLNWCQMMKSKQENALVEQLMKLIRQNTPDLIHECPYTVC